MIDNSTSKNALISAVLTLAACSLPARKDHELESSLLRSENFGNSRGVSEICQKSECLSLEITNGSSTKVTFPLPSDINQDGQNLIIDGVAHSISLIKPTFLEVKETDTFYRDTFGNAIKVCDLGIPTLDPIPSIVVNFPLKTSALGDLSSFDFDLRPLGGPLVTDFVIGKTLSPTGNERIVSDLDSSVVNQRFKKSIPGLIEGTRSVEHLWNHNGLELIENIVLLDHPAIFACCNEGSPFKFMVSTAFLDTLKAHKLDTAPLARHESLHILDRYLGYPSQTDEFKSLFKKITDSNPSFFKAINEETVFKNKNMGGHSADNPKELFASFLNMAMHYDQLGETIPANLQETANEISRTLLALIEATPNRSGKGLELTRILKRISTENGL
jgi:hypothetical protein